MIARIASLGDSTSCGEGVGLRVPSGSTWPARLAAACPGSELIPLAAPGSRLRDLCTGQLEAALSADADVFTVLIGLNDVSRAGFDRRTFAADLAEVVVALRSTGGLVLLGRLHDVTAVLPLPPGLRDAVRARTAQVNEAVDACAGDRVHLMDLTAVAGHALIAQAAARVLRQAGCRVGPVRQPRLPDAPGPAKEAWWLLRHGLPWFGSHLPQVVLPAVGATLRRGHRA